MRLAHTVAELMQGNRDRPAIGEREKHYTIDTATGVSQAVLRDAFTTTTYGELWTQVESLASNLYHSTQSPLHEGDRVAILSFTNAGYAAIDIACIRLGAVSVHLQSNASTDQLTAIIDETQPVIIACSMEQLETALLLAGSQPSVGRIILLDHDHLLSAHTDLLHGARAQLAALHPRVRVDALCDSIREGRDAPAAPFPKPAEGSDPLSMLIYTSGSTGSPKGAMYTERLALGMWGGAWSKIFSEGTATTIHYMPMSHVAGHSSLKNMLARGGTSFFTSQSNLSSFLDDIALARPTELSLVPRVCELIHQRYSTELLKARRDAAAGEDIELKLNEHFRCNVLGGRINWAGCASAPLSSTLASFMESILGIPMHNIYGSTEAGVVWLDNELTRPPVLDYKIVDAPELGYFRSDIPYPRGELLLKTTTMIPGYYNSPELSAALLDAEGYYATGDIMADHGNNRLSFVARRRNVVKLSQGEFIATSRLEAAYAASPLIESIYIHASSERSAPSAVIVPSAEVIAQYKTEISAITRLMRDALRQIARSAGYRSYEIPREILIETIPFRQNGLLSDHGKPLWPRLRDHYSSQLSALYDASRHEQGSELIDAYLGAANSSTLDTLIQLARATGGDTAGSQPSAAQSFRDIGGDSLSAVHFTLAIEDVFQVKVPLDVLISPAYDFLYIANYIDEKRRTPCSRPDYAHIHGAAATQVFSNQLNIEQFLDDAALTADASATSTTDRSNVLLTGASGYLGKFLCLKLLQDLAVKREGKLICIVRAKDDAAAWRRLEQSFGTTGSPLSNIFRSLSDRLQVFAGDLAEHRLGLSEQRWRYLTDAVETIFHAGALVNHVLPYKDMFDANVVGTAELIGLAVERRIKPMTFISSIAVAAQTEKPSLDEYCDIRSSLPYQHLSANYASGYAISKWAGEVLLREAHEKYGLPVTVFRSSMILGHREFPGHLNATDMFSRLVASIISTGSAPKSFYTHNGHRAHYDGLPVDFTATAIVALAGCNDSDHVTYNLVNPHDDGISLDLIVDWLTTAGFDILRSDDYTRWIRDFENSMQKLPDHLRQHSFLPLLNSIQEPLEPTAGSAIPSDRFQQAIIKLGADGDAMQIPPVSESLVLKYVEDLIHLGMIAPNLARSIPHAGRLETRSAHHDI